MPKTIYADTVQPNVIGRSEVFSVKEIQKHQTKSGDPYYRLKLVDKTGMLDAKIWKNDFTSCTPDAFVTGDIVEVDFETSTFNGQIQLTIKKMVKATDFDLHELIKMSDKNVDEMYEKLISYLESIKDGEIRGLVLKVAKDETTAKKLKHALAAEKVHHDYVGGLLEHMLEMYAIAETVISLYPRANRSIIFAGIFFHDLGKLDELATKDAAFVRTTEGYLIGHITIAVRMFDRAVPPEFSEDKRLAIEHIILSHHRELEFGSPVKPATLEAIIVALADYTSSFTRMYQKELDEKTPDETGFGQFHAQQKTKIYHLEIPETE